MADIAGRTVAEALREGAALIEACSVNPRVDAEFLMASALGVSRSQMLLHRMNDPVPQQFDRFVDMARDHHPIAYLVGEEDFHGRYYEVTPDVLIPRGDSETTLEAALSSAPAARRVLDCGTGSGALLLAYLSERPVAVGVGIDRSEAALAVARRNAERHGLSDRCDFRRVDWTDHARFASLGTFDLVIANPPYIAQGDPAVEQGVRKHEPHDALYAGEDGLDAYRALIPQLRATLEPGGTAVFEIGPTQDVAVTEIAGAAGFAASLRRDLAGRARALILT